MKKIRIKIEHASGKVENLNVSHIIAELLTKRLIEQGWPYCTIYINEKMIIEQAEATNSFNARSNSGELERIIL